MLTHDASRTPKDTLLALNTCLHRIAAALQCARPCIASSMQLNPANCLAAAGTRDSCRMRITQSISLSNINAFFRRPRPEAVETCRMLPACLLIGVICFLESKQIGGDQETVNDSGGAERDRTADLMLAKHALSQLSYSPTFWRLWQRWWAWVESNYRPHPYQGCALTN